MPRRSRRATASASQSPRGISQSSTSAAAKTSTASNSSGAKDRSRNSRRSGVGDLHAAHLEAANRLACAPTHHFPDRRSASRATAAGCPQPDGVTRDQPGIDGAAEHGAGELPVCSRVNASTRRLSNSRSFHSAVTASGTSSPDRIVTIIRAPPLAASWYTSVDDKGSSHWASSTTTTRSRPAPGLYARRPTSRRLSWSVDSHGPIERAQRHGGAGLGVQHTPHHQPARLGRRGQGASQGRFADPAIAHQNAHRPETPRRARVPPTPD